MSSCTITDQLLNDRYKVIRPLGTGGMGQTYLAEDTRRPGNPQCVVKQLKPASTDPKFLVTAKRLFDNEAVILEKLGRTNDQIPQLLERFEKDGEFYLAQDFVDGHPLSNEMPLGERWSEIQVIQLLKEVLTVLDIVHRAGVIHRDIKPDNLIRRQDGKLCLIDFGAVKQIRTCQATNSQLISVASVAIGTLGYMPTEQSRGRPRPNSDLYALGMVAVQALTGMLPSQLREDETGEAIWRDQAEVSEGLAGFLNKMIRYHFKERFETAKEALQALEQVTAGQATQEAAESNHSTQQSVKRPYQPTVEAESNAASHESESAKKSKAWEDPSTVEEKVFEEPLQQNISEPILKQESKNKDVPSNKNRLLLTVGTIVMSLVLIAGTAYVHTRNQQEQTIQNIEKALANNQFDECLAQVQVFPQYHSDLYARAKTISGKCQTANVQQSELQAIQKLKADGQYAEAIRKAEAFSDPESKFYEEVRKVMAESQLALAQQLAEKSSFVEAIAILTKIDSPDASVQQKAQSLKFEWSDRIYNIAEELYQKGRDRKDFNKALAIAKAVPQGSPAYNRAQATIKQWEATEPKNWDDLEASQRAIQEGRWQDVKDVAARLMNSPSEAWRKQGQSLNAQAEEGMRKEATPIDEEGKLGSGETGVLVRADNSTFFRDYEFNGREGDAITIGLRGDFDTKLYLISPDKQEIELSNDVSRSNRNSSITTKLRQTGIYKVRVNAFYRTDDSQGRGQGSYRVAVHREKK